MKGFFSRQNSEQLAKYSFIKYFTVNTIGVKELTQHNLPHSRRMTPRKMIPRMRPIARRRPYSPSESPAAPAAAPVAAPAAPAPTAAAPAAPIAMQSGRDCGYSDQVQLLVFSEKTFLVIEK